MNNYEALPITAPIHCLGKPVRFRGHPGNWAFDEICGFRAHWQNERRILEACGRGMMVDVGAYIGVSTIFASEFFDHVLAFEPSSYNCGLLKHNLELNDVRNVSVEQVALSDHLGSADLYLGPDENGVCHSLQESVPHAIFGATRKEQVNIRTLDSYLEQIKNCTFLQVDAEGFDLAVLRGGIVLITTQRPLVRLEFAPRMWRQCGANATRLWEFSEIIRGKFYADFGNNFCPVTRRMLEEMFGEWSDSHWGWLDLYFVPSGRCGEIFK